MKRLIAWAIVAFIVFICLAMSDWSLVNLNY